MDATPLALPVALIVEDNLLVLDVIAEVVGSLGYRVIEATDGPTAIAAMEAAGRTGFDLLLTDQRLPGPMSGTELAAHFRGLFPLSHILVTSGEPLTGDLPGMDFLQKPFTAAMLEAALMSESVEV